MTNKTDTLTINIEKGKNVAIILFEKFNSPEGIFGHNEMPKDTLPSWGSNLNISRVARGSYEHLMFITLIVSIDYQRDANQLWKAGRKTFEDEQTRWLFYPEEVTKRNLNQVINAMKIHKLSKKLVKDAEIWYKVSKSLFEFYNSDPLNLIKECNYDALKIYRKKI